MYASITFLAETLECTLRLVDKHKYIHKDTAASNSYEWKQNPKIKGKSLYKTRIGQN